MASFKDAVADAMFAPESWQSKAPDDIYEKGQPVGPSADLTRILALPRRAPLDLESVTAQAIVDLEMAKYARPNANCICKQLDPNRECIKRLLPVQAWMLREIGMVQGLLANVPVGGGKSLVDLIAPLALRDCPRPLLLIPATLVTQIMDDYRMIAQHFRVPGIIVHAGANSPPATLVQGEVTLHVLPYSRLSLPESSDWLSNLGPTAIIADECFPGSTLVETDEGPVQISDIVDHGRTTFALSYSAEHGHVWRRITARMCRAGNKRLVNVRHEHGELTCTEDHKIWTDNRGYVKAAELDTTDTLRLSGMRRTVQAETVDQEVLLKEVRHQGTSPSYIGDQCEKERRTRDNQAGLPLLRQGVRAASVPGCAALQRELFETTHSPRDNVREMRDSRRTHTQNQEVEISGSPENFGVECARVVSVTFLEQGSIGGHDTCCERDPVYDLTVEGEHNYFADGVLVSNCDSLKDRTSSRTMRLLKYVTGDRETMTEEQIKQRRRTKVCGWTGSLSDNKLMEFAHLSLLALRENSPVPIVRATVEEWGQCLDATDWPSPPGELMKFCELGEDVRSGYRRRLADTLGFITTSSSDVIVESTGEKVELIIREREAPEIPEIVRTALAMVRKGKRPDTLVGSAHDEELADAMIQARCAHEVATGVFYRWKFPPQLVDGIWVPQEAALIDEWYDARAPWNKAVRTQSQLGRTYLDSAQLCEHAAMRAWGDLPERPDRPSWKCEHWPRWRDVKDRVFPEQEAMLLDDYLIKDAAAWGLENRGIIWYGMAELGRLIAKESGLTLHTGGQNAGAKLKTERGDKSIICSIKSHGRGRNGLQFIFDHQLIINTMASATAFEQLFGRTDRRGQKSNKVTTEIYLHTPELRKSFKQAIRRSKYVENILGQRQKLVKGLGLGLAEYEDDDDE